MGVLYLVHAKTKGFPVENCQEYHIAPFPDSFLYCILVLGLHWVRKARAPGHPHEVKLNVIHHTTRPYSSAPWYSSVGAFSGGQGSAWDGFAATETFLS